jgi:N-acetylmuramoyl-L-alanine amidase
VTTPIRRARTCVALLCVLACSLSGALPAAALGPAVTSTNAQVWVAGRQIAFSHLGITYGDPVARIDDPGLRSMLAAVGARSSWQPGTRFIAITRGDGKLVTFTIGSDAVSVDGVPASMPFAPFNSGPGLYLPLLPLAKALDLGVRGFRGGYVFVPQIVSVTPRREGPVTIVRIVGSAPLAWHSSYANSSRAHTLTVSFPGFGTDASGPQPIATGLATRADVSENGPPGFPTTSVTIALKHAAMFAARRVGSGAAVDVVIARDDAQLRAAAPASTPSSVRVVVTPLKTPPPAIVTPTPVSPTPAPAPPTLAPAAGSSTSPGASPSGIATAEPLGPGASPSSSESPSASPGALASTPPLTVQKITDVSVAEVPTGTRITLTLTGPVAFEWHRLGDPDDRYWLDIGKAILVGPAQTLQSKLAFIKEIKVSQHALDPDQIVRVSIMPAQAVDVRVGTIAGAPNQLGIEIENQPPAPDAPIAGIGNTFVTAQASTPPSTAQPVLPGRTDPALIVIDPGHGGSDPGSLNPAYGLTESHITLDIAKRLEADLKKQGWKVVMTRDGDYDVGDPNGSDAQELQARCDVANAAGARLFVSVHINSSVSAAPTGGTTYYWHPQDRAFAQAVENDMITAVGITDDGVIRNNFYVVHHTRMPSILVEVAYLSNPHDAALLSKQSFLDQVAAGIAHGIGDYTGGPPAPVGLTRPSQPSGAPKP